MQGDLFCQIVFFYVCDFVWKKNDIQGKQKFLRQEAMLKSLFLIDDTEAWRNEYTREESIVPVLNWKGDIMIHATRTVVNKIVAEACMLGPVAAMFGREFQQFLIEHGDRTTIRVATMQKSVDKGRASLGTYDIKELRTEAVNKSTKATSSQVKKQRTRTPPRDRGSRGHAQAPWKEERRTSHPTYRREDHREDRRDDRRDEIMRTEYDARYQDRRYNPNYQRLQQQKNNQMEIERLQQEQEFLRQQDLLDQERLRESRKRTRERQHRDSSRPKERRNSRNSHRGDYRDERPRNQRQSDYDKPRRSFHKEDHRPRR